MHPRLKNQAQTTSSITARKLLFTGKVQGVGFRPFIYRLAKKNHLTGWVKNCVGIVEIQVQGREKNIDQFIREIFETKPSIAEPRLESNKPTRLDTFQEFCILQSQHHGDTDVSVPNDLFLCDDCLAEMNDPADRRYRYPFTNCTQCGPRYTLINNLPYDRANTTMAGFKLCPSCRKEYEDPDNRRFHAEPTACPSCGPSLSLSINTKLKTTITTDDILIKNNETSLKFVVNALHNGRIVAVKGIGGYHLMCDASNREAIARLRQKKARPDKPFAVMFPSPAEKPFHHANVSVELSDEDKTFLSQPSRPILLVKKKPQSKLSAQIAPGLNEIGVMLPYSPLHHLLLNDFGGPLIATSANISGEPVLTENIDVESRLAHIADAFLHHNRPIARPADDPVYKTIAGKARPLRTGRGISPMEFTLPFELAQPVLAVGAQMKNTVTLAWGDRAVLSPHIGEMFSFRSLQIFENTVNDLQELYGIKASAIICDAHPGYTTTRWANKQRLPVHNVLHHYAHASSAYYECNTHDPAIVFSWDGVGYGGDGTLWGGETFVGRPGDWQRVASMRPFNLPGGDKASREPWRSAAALCWETGQPYENFSNGTSLLQQAWQKSINAPQSTSVGRLFDAAAALIGLRNESSFEGQGPMELEALCQKVDRNRSTPQTDEHIVLPLEKSNALLRTDWQPLVTTMSDSTLSISSRAALFHSSLAHVILQQANVIRDMHDVNIVSFSGGVFQNAVLTEQAINLLSNNGFEVYLPELIPVNDAGISFGQVMEYGYKR